MFGALRGTRALASAPLRPLPGELRAQTCASQLTRPCLAGQWLRQTTAGPPNVRRLQCSASRQMVADQDTTTALTALLVDRVPCLSDNYAWLLREESGKVAVVDPSEAQPVIQALENRSLKLDYILNTHHHWDHVGGNEELKRRYGATVVGPAADRARIPAIDVALADGETWRLGSLEMRVMDVPGHTRGHVALWFPQAEALFSGDTLFALGCGRLFEGTPKQMWQSLAKLRELPPSTAVFCGHEYTQSNARFAKKVDSGNTALAERVARIDELRAQGKATVPSRLGEELETNPFLRPSSAAIREALGVPANASDVEAFAAIRAAKDNA